MKSCRAANDRWVVGESSVAVQFDELVKQSLNVIQGVRAIRMASQLNAFERSPGALVTRPGRDRFRWRMFFLFRFLSTRFLFPENPSRGSLSTS